MKYKFTKPVHSLIFALVMTACFGVEANDSDFKYAKGTVKYIPIEGGFYGIVTDDNKNFDPMNLPKEFQKDGVRIYFKYVEKKNIVSAHMWGTII
ncbi:MAG: hypothetical protein AB1298_05485 [Bacteroidota bacterium]